MEKWKWHGTRPQFIARAVRRNTTTELSSRRPISGYLFLEHSENGVAVCVRPSSSPRTEHRTTDDDNTPPRDSDPVISEFEAHAARALLTLSTQRQKLWISISISAGCCGQQAKRCLWCVRASLSYLHCMCQHLQMRLFNRILVPHRSLIPLKRFHLGDVNFCLERRRAKTKSESQLSLQ